MKVLIKLASLLLLVSSFSLQAIETELNECKLSAKTVVVYSNGMFNEEKDIFKSKDVLKREVQNLIEEGVITLEEGEIVEYDTAKNIPSNALSQLADVIWQKLDFPWYRFWAMMHNTATLPFDKDDDEFRVFSATLKDYENTINNEIVTKMVSKYIKYLEDGYRVIIVAHSQGNMYAQTAYAKILDQDNGYRFKNSISIVSVGTPVDDIPRANIPYLGNKKHATAATDIYMWLVRGVTVGTNGWYTFHYDKSFKDLMGHSFTNAYMADSESKKVIASGLQWAFENTQFPPTSEVSELYRIDLIKSSPDVTMFIEEEFYVGEYISSRYITGKSVSFTAEKLNDEMGPFLVRGFGNYYSSSVKDIYTLPCSSIEEMKEHYGYENTTVSVIVYLINESGEEQSGRIEFFDWQNAKGSYTNFTVDNKFKHSDYISPYYFQGELRHRYIGGHYIYRKGLGVYINSIDNKLNTKIDKDKYEELK